MAAVDIYIYSYLKTLGSKSPLIWGRPTILLAAAMAPYCRSSPLLGTNYSPSPIQLPNRLDKSQVAI